MLAVAVAVAVAHLMMSHAGSSSSSSSIRQAESVAHLMMSHADSNSSSSSLDDEAFKQQQAGRVSSSLDDDEPVVCEEGGESIVGVALLGGARLMDDGIHSML